VQQELSEFFENNPFSELKIEQEENLVIRPWGDKTLSILIPSEEEQKKPLIQVLNDITLPQELSGILHRKTGQLEILWTAYRLQSHSLEVKDRKFSFRWNNRNRACGFGKSSEEALTLAKHCIPVSNASSTDHRNIVSFHLSANEREHPMLETPMSFFVDCEGLSHEEMMLMLSNLNAYMIYFDRRTPRILMHSVSESVFEVNSRLLEDEFPAKISAKDLDGNLLSYWTEAFSTKDEVMRYLLMYRIVEYTSFSFIEGETLRAVRRELSKPSLPNRVDATARKLTEVIVQSKEIDQINRVQNMITSLVDLERLWSCIEKNIDYFKGDQTFDGGYKVKHLVSGKCDFETWKPNAVRTTFDRLRSLRNALAHGQDGSTRGTIRPTRQNAQLLVPWLNVLETIASDVMFLHDHN